MRFIQTNFSTGHSFLSFNDDDIIDYKLVFLCNKMLWRFFQMTEPLVYSSWQLVSEDQTTILEHIEKHPANDKETDLKKSMSTQTDLFLPKDQFQSFQSTDWNAMSFTLAIVIGICIGMKYKQKESYVERNIYY